MKKMKQICSFLIVAAMLLTQAVFVMADNGGNAGSESVEITDSDRLRVEKLEAFGAITNEYADLGAYVTRRQMTDIIVAYMRLGSQGVGDGKSPFIDVSASDASFGNIIALYNQGVITGDEALCFHPDDNLTYDDALVFVINSIGYKLLAAREGGYPTGYHRMAIRLDMLSDLTFQSGKEYILLCDVYKLLDKALDADAIVTSSITTGTIDYEVSDTETVLSELYNIRKFSGVVTGNEFTYLTNADSSLTDEQVAIDGVVYDTPGYTYTTSLGRAVYYYIRTDADAENEAAYVEEIDRLNNVYTADSDEIIPSKLTDSRIYYEDENGKEKYIKLGDNIDVIYNNHCWRGYGRLANVLPEYGYIEAVDNDGDERADVLFVFNYHNIVVGSVDTFKDTLTAMHANEEGVYETFTLDEDNSVIISMPSNVHMSLSTVNRWDIATIMESKSTPAEYTVYITNQMIEGTVSEISNDEGALIDGTYYKIAEGYVGDNVVAGTSATFRLDFNGKIAAMDTSSVSGTGTLAVLTGIDYNANNMASLPEIRLYTQDGQLLKAELNTNLKLDGVTYKPGGSDVDKVLNILSGGEKSNGEYVVKTPYVVQFKTSGDRISYLDTGKTGEDGKLHPFAVGDSFLSRSQGMLRALNGTSSQGTWIETYFKKGSVIVFRTPDEDDLNDATKYSVSNTLTDHWYYRNSKTYGSAYTKHVDSYAMYDFSPNESLNTAKIILLAGSSASASGLDKYTSALHVVTKLTSAVNAEGGSTKKMYADTGSEWLFAESVDITRDSTTQSDISVADIDKHVKAGMTVQVGTNVDGDIDEILIITDFDSETNTPSRVFTDLGTPGDTEKFKVFGKVVAIDANEGLIQVQDMNGTTVRLTLLPLGTKATLVYRPERDKVSNDSTAAIAIGDYIVVRLTNYYNAGEIVVYKQ